jgi:hypothetical protein
MSRNSEKTRLHPARRRALDPYRLPLLQWCVEHRGDLPDEPCEIRIEGRPFVVDPPELALLRRLQTWDDPRSRDRWEMLSQWVALQAKCTEDLQRLAVSPEEGRAPTYSFQAELMLDYAIGIALINEMQEIVHGAVGGGSMEQAREFSNLRHRMQRWLQEVRDAIAESERLRAQDLSSVLTTLDRRTGPAPRELSEPAGAAVDRPVRRERHREQARKRRARRTPEATLTRHLVQALIVAVGVGVIVTGLPDRSGVTPLDPGEFDRIEAVVGCVSRPTSLFLRADRGMWERLGDEGREELLADVAQVASDHRYTGVLLEDADGRPLAQWLSLRGGRVLSAGETQEASGVPE